MKNRWISYQNFWNRRITCRESKKIGLGLAIAKAIANVNCAEIKLESELGNGSMFVIIFKEYMEIK